MKRTQISLAFTMLAFILCCSGCGIFEPSKTVVSNDPAIRSIVIQYSGGKEIGRWYLDKSPTYVVERGSAWCWFKNGDTTMTLSGDIRILAFPLPNDIGAK